MNHKRLFEINREWDLREDDERRPHVDSPLILDPKATVRISPEGCDSEVESISRQGSGKKSAVDKLKSEVQSEVKINIETVPPLENCNQEKTTDVNDNSLPLDTHSCNDSQTGEPASQQKLSSASVLQMECSV